MDDVILEEDEYCAFCEHALPLRGGEFAVCEKKGVVRATYVCRKFVYDPLKRRPPQNPVPSLEFVDIDAEM